MHLYGQPYICLRTIGRASHLNPEKTLLRLPRLPFHTALRRFKEYAPEAPGGACPIRLQEPSSKGSSPSDENHTGHDREKEVITHLIRLEACLCVSL